MKLIHNQSLYSDKQLIKIQESPNLIPEGETPHAVTAFVYDALVDFVRPGDRVTIVGVCQNTHLLLLLCRDCIRVHAAREQKRFFVNCPATLRAELQRCYGS